ncbi:peptidoglycan editing factor PgeF [Chryseotalea sanaruensis]|uniref:Purine nucleoside phosphorylase n=1 Tax=Chryseotalea sanaruensis TaxID=2482724 RepID=A0A401U5J2_9BACT|nr:peptidoglycan editing factor PgeF [Chryseotalea sanaruensis]GCC50056.1 peptidoglycan editing factor PgeF [Chryseotalea sanaruensis]
MIELKNIGDLKLWQFSKLYEEKNITHFVTDRKSFNEIDFNLSYSTSPDPLLVEVNRKQLTKTIGLDFEQLYIPRQVHKDHILKVDVSTNKDSLEETDALITNDTNVCIAVMSADCVPILLYDKKNQAVGAVHSGWKGTVAHILTKTLQAMQREFGTHGVDVVAAIGPSVCQASYEVGHEVADAVRKSFNNADVLLQLQENGKAKLDLWQANYIQLTSFGVKPENIAVANACTVIHNQHFFSARKGDIGRFAAGIRLLPR